jgi:hypothetical protein
MPLFTNDLEDVFYEVPRLFADSCSILSPLSDSAGKRVLATNELAGKEASSLHTPGRAKSRITEEEILRPGEYRTLMAQCSILVTIGSIVVWLMAA